MSGFGWLPVEDSERLEEEQDWIETHGPIGFGVPPGPLLVENTRTGETFEAEVVSSLTSVLLRIDEADLPEVVASWPVLEVPLSPAELAAMPDSTAQGDHALLAIEEAVREDA